MPIREMGAREQSDDLSVVSLSYPCQSARLMQPCAVESNWYFLLLYPSEESLIGALPDADPEFESVPRLSSQRKGISVSVILSLGLVPVLFLSEGECLSTVHGGPVVCLLGLLGRMQVPP